VQRSGLDSSVNWDRLRTAREIVGSHVPDSVSLADELTAERHEEAKHEESESD
jgi:hypothetical protein